MENKFISVIMPSLLEPIPGGATDRPGKFMRSTDSFLSNKYPLKELIIISDGCDKTIDICNRRYKNEMKKGIINLIKVPKKSPRQYFVGEIRQIGIDRAKGDLLANLDSDDYFLPHHLYTINATTDLENFDWWYFNHLTKPDNIRDLEYYFDCQPKHGHICTANTIWKNGLDVSWIGADGRQDNWIWNEKLINKYPRCTKIYGLGYVVCHVIVKKS